MHRSPYRNPSTLDEPPSLEKSGDTDLILPFALFWLVSLVRVGACFLRRESFGAEPTLAMVALFLLPYLLRDTLLSCARIKAASKMGRSLSQPLRARPRPVE